MLALVACLALVPMSGAHAWPGNASRVEASSPEAGPVSQPEAQPAAALPASATSPRRSRMAGTGPGERPVLRLSAMYRVVGRDAASRDNCLQDTGTRLKRDSTGTGACAIANGRAYVPDR